MVSQKAAHETHPDWVLHHQGVPLNEARQQLVLDLSQPAVVSHLFDAISSLLSAHPIAYIKWDMNRDIHQAGNAEGRHAPHCQTRALYALLRQIKQAFPEVSIETCASGGGAPISAYSSTPHGCGPPIRTMPSIGFESSEAFKTSSHLSSWAHMLDPVPVISPVGNTAWRSERASRLGPHGRGSRRSAIIRRRSRCCPRPLRFTNITASSFTGEPIKS